MLQTEEGEILATTRTYNVGSPEGTYGQTIPWHWRVANSFATPTIVTGARNDSRFRSNLGIVNFSEEAMTMRYRILNGAGAVVAEGSRDLEMFSVNQWSFKRLGVGKVNGPLTVEVWFDSVTLPPCLDPPGHERVESNGEVQERHAGEDADDPREEDREGLVHSVPYRFAGRTPSWSRAMIHLQMLVEPSTME